MKTIELNIQPDQIRGEISPYLFGHFIEFMHDCIDPGLYAQLLVSRGFEFPDANGDGISDPWTAVGFNDSYAYRLDDQVTLTDSHAQVIEIFNHFDGFRGVSQSGLRLERGRKYCGSVWLRSSVPIDFQVGVLTRDGEELYRKDFKVPPGAWNQYEFDFVNRETQTDAAVEFRLCSKGTLWMDQASLVPADVPCGVWPEVMEKMEALRPSVLRFPGGCFADCYHWEDGVGPRDFRPARENQHWGGTEENNFGTDEFIELCRHLNCEPMICVNFGTAGPEEAANWVEYCNGPSDTGYGALRAGNGHPEPYNVVYWDIGNEVFGDWEIGHCDAREYARKYLEFVNLMREKDPNIKLIACAGDGNSIDQSWNEEILSRIGGQTDVLGIHTYTPMIRSMDYDNTDIYYAVVGGAPKKYERIIEETVNSIRKTCGRESGVKLGITEWNTSYDNDSLREHTLEAALCNAGMMNVFLRSCDSIALCNASDLINGWPGGLIRSQKGQAIGTPTYYAIKMYAEAQPYRYIESNYSCDTFQTKAVGNIEEESDVPYVDIVTCADRDGRMILFAVNRCPDRQVAIRVSGVKAERAEVRSLFAEEVSAHNRFGAESVVPTATDCNPEAIALRPHSVNVILLS